MIAIGAATALAGAATVVALLSTRGGETQRHEGATLSNG
jgi:hypothetical protein